MKRLKLVFSITELYDHFETVTSYSYEISKYGLIISSIDLVVRLKIEITDISLVGNTVYLFDVKWKELEKQELSDFERYLINKYPIKITEETNVNEVQMELF